MVSDPIADLLVRLRNAATAGRERLFVPHSKMKEAILTILQQEGVVEDVTDKTYRGRRVLEVTLPPARNRLVPTFVRVSRPGRRIYVSARDIPRPLKGHGLVVLSTPKGILTGREARRLGVGGEVLFVER